MPPNRVGAAGTLGSANVARSAPDGYSLLQANIASNAIAVSLYAKMPYDQLRDFVPITRIGLSDPSLWKSASAGSKRRIAAPTAVP